jgi:hypothetical protein
MSIKKRSMELGVKYITAKQIVKLYKKTGRIVTKGCRNQVDNGFEIKQVINPSENDEKSAQSAEDHNVNRREMANASQMLLVPWNLYSPYSEKSVCTCQIDHQNISLMNLSQTPNVAQNYQRYNKQPYLSIPAQNSSPLANEKYSKVNQYLGNLIMQKYELINSNIKTINLH